MRVLIDECAPRDLKSFLMAEGFHCLTVQEAGWSGKENGELLDRAEDHFDVWSLSITIFAISKTLLDVESPC